MEPIDIVVTWVDPDDPEWLDERLRHQTIGQADRSLCQEELAVLSCRYRDWDLMRYWFRAIERFAPWFGTLHFVTYGHTPEWLNTANPKLSIVKHRDFMPLAYLPTFNSRVIEFNLHRIESLSERFVYFNDDMFLIRPSLPTDYFIDALPCDQAGLSFVVPASSPNINHAEFNTVALLNDLIDKHSVLDRKLWLSAKYPLRDNLRTLFFWKFPLFTGFLTDLHTPQPYLKSSFSELWDLVPETLDETCTHRFRQQSDLRVFLVRYWQLINRRFIPRAITNRAAFFSPPKDIENLHRILANQEKDWVCINDGPLLDDQLFIEIQQGIRDVFDLLLPEKSSFEID